MSRVTPARLQSWAKQLHSDQACLDDIRDRFQMRMLEKFRTAPPAERELINAIMDNEKLFFDELDEVLAEAGPVNDEGTDEEEHN